MDSGCPDGRIAILPCVHVAPGEEPLDRHSLDRRPVGGGVPSAWTWSASRCSVQRGCCRRQVNTRIAAWDFTGSTWNTVVPRMAGTRWGDSRRAWVAGRWTRSLQKSRGGNGGGTAL